MGSTGLRFEALGALRVVGATEVALTRPARRRLLSMLLLDAGRVVTIGQIIDRMWGEQPPGDPRNTVQAHVAGLRRQLGDVIQSKQDGYLVDVAKHWFDVEAFLQAAATVERGDVDDETVVEVAGAALQLWRGDPFPDLDDEYARGRVGALVETRLRTETRWIDALMSCGRGEEALPELERLVAEHPYEERFWERLMLARYRIGNTAGALRAFQSVRTLLGDELGVEPGVRLRALEEQILLHDPALGSPPPHPTPHNLPASRSSYVGRDGDTDAVVSLLERHPFVTVTGGPGVGKTRLAVEVGRRLLGGSPGGVWLVRLVGAASEADVTATIAAAMGVVHDVTDPEELGLLVAGRPALVILDNCEHVLEHVRTFVRAAQAGEGPLRILATSRQRLGLASEQVWRLRPLRLPSPGGADVFESDAVRLLVDRAESADRSFRARDADPAQIAALCRRTDGIPLALELAASWLPSVGVADAFDVAGLAAPGGIDDVDPHHRSLRAAVDWSFTLLSTSDRPLITAASVFAGSFVLDGFQSVCAPELPRPQVAAAISRLVESSLLGPERQGDGSFRYRMLEPVREFAHDRLADRGSADVIHDRHARWFLQRAIELGEVINQETDPAAAQAVIDAELADHRAAMRRLLDTGDHENAARLATALTGYWFARYLGSEATRWLDDALAGSMSDAVRVRALWTAGWAAYSRADYPTATRRYEESLALATAMGDQAATGRALYGIGRIELPRHPERGHHIMDQALEAFGAAPGTRRERGDCLVALGIRAAMGGNVGDACQFLREAREIMEECGSLRSLAIIHRYLSLAAWYAGQADQAREHVDQAERLARQSDDRPAIGGALIQRSLVECRWGERAVAARAMREAIDQLPPRNEIDHCLVFVGALPVLIDAGHHELAARLVDHMDRVFAEYGWVPVDVRMPAVAEFRSTLAVTPPAGGWDPARPTQMADMLRTVLADLV